MDSCVACGTNGTTKAHVKDKSICLKEGITDHMNLNIVDLCYNCHYILFDDRRMGIIKRSEKYYFVFIDDDNLIREIESKYTLNVLQEYIEWKNKRCLPRLWPKLFY
jgi:hypothetical protein